MDEPKQVFRLRYPSKTISCSNMRFCVTVLQLYIFILVLSFILLIEILIEQH